MMIQDIDPHIYNNQYIPREPEAGDYVLIYKNNEVMMIEDLKFPTYERMAAEYPDISDDLRYLFSINNQAFYLAPEVYFTQKPNIYLKDFQIFRELPERWMRFAGITGSQVYRFYQSNQYCGKCGKPMAHSETERAMGCEPCKTIKYPQIAPAVIVGVTDGDKLLMTRYAGRAYTRYALIAGFMEVGESLEETVRREVLEEVGVHVKNIRYYKNQPWSFSDSLLVGFFAELDGAPEITLDEQELAEGKWFSREDIPEGDNSGISLTQEMIEYFRNQK